MPEASPSPWILDVVVFVGVFSAMTWGFLVLFKPRTYRPDPPEDAEE